MAGDDSFLEPDEDMALSDLVGRVLDRGTVIAGDVVISVAGVDLIHLGLNLFLASAETVRRHGLRPAPFRVAPPVEASGLQVSAPRPVDAPPRRPEGPSDPAAPDPRPGGPASDPGGEGA